MNKQIIFSLWIFGFISGFTLLISSNTLNFWLSSKGVDKSTIGLFSIVSLPYAINFIWAPIIDSQKVPFLSRYLGHRLGWVIILQMMLVISVIVISYYLLSAEIYIISFIAFITSLLSSTQDAALSAIKTVIIPNNRQGEFSGLYIFGYRTGMTFSGSIAIYLSTIISWQIIYQIFAIIILLFSIILILLFYNRSKEIDAFDTNINNITTNYSIKNFFLRVFKPIGSSKIIFTILTFLVLYRLPDNFIYVMMNSFLLEIGFNEFEIASAGKLLGTISATLGGILGSYLVHHYKWNILSSLLYFGILHAIAHSLFIIQDICGKNVIVFMIINIIESSTGGMAMSAYIGFISSICVGKYRATQYSLFSAMMGVSRSIFPTLSGFLANFTSWKLFFIIITLVTIPAMLLAILLSKHLIHLQQK